MDSGEDIVEQIEREQEEEHGSEGEQASGNEEAVEVQADEAEEQEETPTPTVVKPKRVVKNPQPKLNADTLRGTRGLTVLPALFAKQPLKGKGHEESDLNVILKTYEYWCHRLYPKLPFNQCITKIETLGAKKPVMTYIKKIRMGIEDDPVISAETVVSEDEETAPTVQQQQQIESVEARFDDFASNQNRPSEVEQLTEMQLEMIRVNKERALKLRQDRLRRIQEQAKSNLQESSVLAATDSLTPSQLNSTQEEEQLGISMFEKELQKEIGKSKCNMENTEDMDVANSPQLFESCDLNTLQNDNLAENDNNLNVERDHGDEPSEIAVEDLLNNLNNTMEAD